jgi:hypothetical protein
MSLCPRTHACLPFRALADLEHDAGQGLHEGVGRLEVATEFLVEGAGARVTK